LNRIIGPSSNHGRGFVNPNKRDAIVLGRLCCRSEQRRPEPWRRRRRPKRPGVEPPPPAPRALSPTRVADADRPGEPRAIGSMIPERYWRWRCSRAHAPANSVREARENILFRSGYPGAGLGGRHSPDAAGAAAAKGLLTNGQEGAYGRIYEQNSLLRTTGITERPPPHECSRQRRTRRFPVLHARATAAGRARARPFLAAPGPVLHQYPG